MGGGANLAVIGPSLKILAVFGSHLLEEELVILYRHLVSPQRADIDLPVFSAGLRALACHVAFVATIVTLEDFCLRLGRIDVHVGNLPGADVFCQIWIPF